MNVTDMSLFNWQAAKIRVPSGGTRQFVAGSAQSAAANSENEPAPVTCEEVLSVITASPRPMTASAVARLLNTSAGQASQALKYLVKRGTVRRQGTPGKRGAVYELS